MSLRNIKNKINKENIKNNMMKIAIYTTGFSLMSSTVFADSIADSKLATGFERLIDDCTSVLMKIIIAVGICTILVAFFMKSKVTMNPDEMDQRKWDKVWHTALISMVASVVVRGLVTIILSYFS